MPSKNDPAPPMQRNALAPSLLAAIMLFTAPALFGSGNGMWVLYTVSILALIVAWFAGAAGQWWWTVVFVIVAIVWNPIFPFAFEGVWWTAAQPVAAVTFITAGALIKSPRE